MGLIKNRSAVVVFCCNCSCVLLLDNSPCLARTLAIGGKPTTSALYGNGCLREFSGIQAFRLGPGSEPYVGNINTRFTQAKIINLTMMCNKIPSG